MVFGGTIAAAADKMPAMTDRTPPSRAHFDVLAAQAGLTLPAADAAALYDAFCALRLHLQRLRKPGRRPEDEMPPMRLTFGPTPQ